MPTPSFQDNINTLKTSPNPQEVLYANFIDAVSQSNFYSARKLLKDFISQFGKAAFLKQDTVRLPFTITIENHTSYAGEVSPFLSVPIALEVPCLSFAILKKSQFMVEALLAAGAHIEAPSTSLYEHFDQLTPVMLTTDNDILVLLLTYHPNLLHISKAYETCLCWDKDRQIIKEAAEKNDQWTALRLLDAQYHRRHQKNMTNFEKSYETGDFKQFETLFIQTTKLSTEYIDFYGILHGTRIRSFSYPKNQDYEKICDYLNKFKIYAPPKLNFKDHAGAMTLEESYETLFNKSAPTGRPQSKATAITHALAQVNQFLGTPKNVIPYFKKIQTLLKELMASKNYQMQFWGPGTYQVEYIFNLAFSVALDKIDPKYKKHNAFQQLLILLFDLYGLAGKEARKWIGFIPPFDANKMIADLSATFDYARATGTWHGNAGHFGQRIYGDAIRSGEIDTHYVEDGVELCLSAAEVEKSMVTPHPDRSSIPWNAIRDEHEWDKMDFRSPSSVLSFWALIGEQEGFDFFGNYFRDVMHKSVDKNVKDYQAIQPPLVMTPREFVEKVKDQQVTDFYTPKKLLTHGLKQAQMKGLIDKNVDVSTLNHAAVNVYEEYYGVKGAKNALHLTSAVKILLDNRVITQSQVDSFVSLPDNMQENIALLIKLAAMLGEKPIKNILSLDPKLSCLNLKPSQLKALLQIKFEDDTYMEFFKHHKTSTLANIFSHPGTAEHFENLHILVLNHKKLAEAGLIGEKTLSLMTMRQDHLKTYLAEVFKFMDKLKAKDPDAEVKWCWKLMVNDTHSRKGKAINTKIQNAVLIAARPKSRSQ